MRLKNTTKKNPPQKKTYNTGYSLVVTDPTTDPALPGLSEGERTGSRVFLEVWSYVLLKARAFHYLPQATPPLGGVVVEGEAPQAIMRRESRWH